MTLYDLSCHWFTAFGYEEKLQICIRIFTLIFLWATENGQKCLAVGCYYPHIMADHRGFNHPCFVFWDTVLWQRSNLCLIAVTFLTYCSDYCAGFMCSCNVSFSLLFLQIEWMALDNNWVMWGKSGCWIKDHIHSQLLCAIMIAHYTNTNRTSLLYSAWTAAQTDRVSVIQDELFVRFVMSQKYVVWWT